MRLRLQRGAQAAQMVVVAAVGDELRDHLLLQHRAGDRGAELERLGLQKVERIARHLRLAREGAGTVEHHEAKTAQAHGRDE